MATFALSGTGVQSLSANVTGLHVSITTYPPNPGHGLANPANYYNAALLRFGDGTGYTDVLAVVGGPQWIPCPAGSTSLAYACLNGTTISVAEVIGSSVAGGSLSGLSDVAVVSPTSGQVLTYDAPSGKWVNLAPAAPPAGGLVKYAETVFSTATNTITFGAGGTLPQTYRNIRLTFQGRSDTSSQIPLIVRFNGDSSGIYDYQVLTANGTGVSASQSTGTTSAFAGQLVGSNAAGGEALSTEFVVLNYASSTFRKTWNARYSTIVVAGTIYFLNIYGRWASTNPITSLVVLANSNNWIAGSVATLYFEA